jgi:hypothetical protein
MSLKIASPAKEVATRHRKFSKVHIGSRFAHAFQPPVRTRLCKRIVQSTTEVIQNHEKKHARTIGQGETRHRKYKRLKLGGDAKLPL